MLGGVMTFVKTRSGRYLKLDSIIGFAIEEEKMEIEGKRQIVFEIIAYLPQPLNPAILEIFFIRRVSKRRIRKINSKINSRKRKNSLN
jgi:hypothetical protein